MGELPGQASEFEPSPERERLIELVIDLANIDGGDESDVVKMGIIRLGSDDILMARIKQPHLAPTGLVYRSRLAHQFKLTVYHLSKPRLDADGTPINVESLAVSDMLDEPVVSDNGTTDYYSVDQADGAQVIRDFFDRHQLGHLDRTQPNTE